MARVFESEPLLSLTVALRLCFGALLYKILFLPLSTILLLETWSLSDVNSVTPYITQAGPVSISAVSQHFVFVLPVLPMIIVGRDYIC